MIRKKVIPLSLSLGLIIGIFIGCTTSTTNKTQASSNEYLTYLGERDDIFGNVNEAVYADYNNRKILYIAKNSTGGYITQSVVDMAN